jgi:endonuclease YncB( thermonuclease family)
MNMPLSTAPAAKLIGAGVLIASLLAMTGCGSAESASKPGVDNGTPAASASASATQKPASLRGTLASIISGDTVVLTPVSDANGQPTGDPKVTVHILGIKAPALTSCGGPASAAELKRIISDGGYFRVTYDPQSARVDSKGDVQGYLAAGDGGTSMDVGTAMIRNGFAAAWYDSSDHAPTRYAANSKTTQIAQSQKTGIWASCPTTLS